MPGQYDHELNNPCPLVMPSMGKVKEIDRSPTRSVADRSEKIGASVMLHKYSDIGDWRLEKSHMKRREFMGAITP